MAEVTWFKVLTDIFSDDKIKILQSMPEGDSLLVMWFKVLAQAGKTNDGGYIYLKKNIPYTAGMLSTLFGKQQQLVELAMRTFSEFGMIDIDEKGYVFVTNWEKHQSIDALEKIKEQDRLRAANYRERKRLELNGNHVTVTLPSQSNHATEIELEVDIEKDKDNKKEYAKKVFLSEKEYQKLIDKFGEDETEYWIQKLSHYKVKKKIDYDSDYLTALNWERKENRPAQSHLKLAPEQDKPKRTKAQLSADREIALNRWVEGGNDPSGFVFEPIA